MTSMPFASWTEMEPGLYCDEQLLIGGEVVVGGAEQGWLCGAE